MRRSRSRREFAAKLQIVCEESDECVLWLEIAGVLESDLADVPPLLTEARELRAIFNKAKRSLRGSD
jgi:four helix bundle protein